MISHESNESNWKKDSDFTNATFYLKKRIKSEICLLNANRIRETLEGAAGTVLTLVTLRGMERTA